MDGDLKFLDEEFQEFFTGSLESFTEALGCAAVAGLFGEFGGEVLNGGVGVSNAKAERGVVAVFGDRDLVGFETGPDAFDDGLAPDAIVVGIGCGRIDEVAWGEGLEFAAAEVVDDEAVDDGAEVVAEAALGFVGAGEFVSEELCPEVLKDLVGEVGVAEFEFEVAFDGVVIAADEVAHGGLAGGSDGVCRSDLGPAGFEPREVLVRGVVLLRRLDVLFRGVHEAARLGMPAMTRGEDARLVGAETRPALPS